MCFKYPGGMDGGARGIPAEAISWSFQWSSGQRGVNLWWGFQMKEYIATQRENAANLEAHNRQQEPCGNSTVSHGF